nr:hypothetical protein [Bacillus alkalicellulosilyticus]
MDEFHCCATCKHYLVTKEHGKINTLCKRLGYNTKAKHQFNCWDPKENVLKLMEKRKNSSKIQEKKHLSK